MNKEKKSSDLLSSLVTNSTKYIEMLREEFNFLKTLHSDEGLSTQFEKLSKQTISICPMALCDSLLADLKIECPIPLLKGLGLMLAHISTHDDIVDEPKINQKTTAELIYSGSIAYGHGIKLLLQNNMTDIAQLTIAQINKNHEYQTKIVSKLWQAPTDRDTYLDAIITTRSWAFIGLDIAIKYANREDLHAFIQSYSDYYGNVCQLYDDIREIKQDLDHHYFSLPISYAFINNLKLKDENDITESIEESKKLAKRFIHSAKSLTKNKYSHLYELIKNIERLGTLLIYHDNFKTV